jgi:hypothetical protein
MMKLHKLLIASAPPLVLAPLPPLLLPAAVCAQVDADSESVTVSPSALEKIQIRKTTGDVDKRSASVGKEGLITVGPGDGIEVMVKPPAEMVGKRGSFTLEYFIREEFNKNCKKHIIDHPVSDPREFDAPLELGKHVRAELVLESLDDPNVVQRTELKAGPNGLIVVRSGARVLVKFHLPASQVVFEARDSLTQEEIDKHVEPELAALRRNPNVIIGNPAFANVSVQPGNVAELTVQVIVRRGRR